MTLLILPNRVTCEFQTDTAKWRQRLVLFTKDFKNYCIKRPKDSTLTTPVTARFFPWVNLKYTLLPVQFLGEIILQSHQEINNGWSLMLKSELWLRWDIVNRKRKNNFALLKQQVFFAITQTLHRFDFIIQP